MTDTTDAALNQLKFVADCCIENPDSIYASEFFLLLDEIFGMQGDYSMPVQAVAVSCLIGKLEAERQRAAGSEEELHKALHREKAAERKLLAAQEEIAELKGDQVPVAFTGSGSLAAIKGGHEGHIWGASAEAHPVPLYDRPQKPVVLPKSHYVCGCADRFMSAPEVIAAIEAAGGIVKNGE